MERQIDFTDNDIYFIETVRDKILVNSNYNGLTVYDCNLNKVKELFFDKDFTIYSAFKNGEEVLLYCPDDSMLLCLDISTYSYFTIELDRKYNSYTFLDSYWSDDKIVLKTSSDDCLAIDLQTKSIQLIALSVARSIYEDVKLDYEVPPELGVIFHEKQTMDGVTAYVGEETINIEIEGNTFEIYPQKEYMFLHLKFLKTYEGIFAYILSTCKTDSMVSRLQMIDVNTDLGKCCGR